VPSMEAMYVASATSTGGRSGHAVSSDGHVDVDIVVPTELGGPGGPGTNPEQLFAAGYAACFNSALQLVAGKRGHDASAAKVTADVGLKREGRGFGLEVELRVAIPGIDHDTAHELAEKAHEVCPYSNATRGNIEVALTVEDPATVA
jgi:lipoyl-dependent peroxiredoxin